MRSWIRRIRFRYQLWRMKRLFKRFETTVLEAGAEVRLFDKAIRRDILSSPVFMDIEEGEGKTLGPGRIGRIRESPRHWPPPPDPPEADLLPEVKGPVPPIPDFRDHDSPRKSRKKAEPPPGDKYSPNIRGLTGRKIIATINRSPSALTFDEIMVDLGKGFKAPTVRATLGRLVKRGKLSTEKRNGRNIYFEAGSRGDPT